MGCCSSSPIPNDFYQLKGNRQIAGMSKFDKNSNLPIKLEWLYGEQYRVMISLEKDGAPTTKAAVEAFVGPDGGKMEWFGCFLKDWHCPSVSMLLKYCEKVAEHVRKDEHVVTHCWGGSGRTGVFLAAYIIYSSREGNRYKAHEALAQVRAQYKIHAVELETQYLTLCRFCDHLEIHGSKKLSELTKKDHAGGHFDPEQGGNWTVDPGHAGEPLNNPAVFNEPDAMKHFFSDNKGHALDAEKYGPDFIHQDAEGPEMGTK